MRPGIRLPVTLLVTCAACTTLASSAANAQNDTTLRASALQFRQITRNLSELTGRLSDSASKRAAVADTLLSNVDPTKATISQLATRLVRLDSLRAADDREQRGALKTSYEYGSKALIQMIGATRTIKFLQSALDVEIELNHSTNPWADNDFRNGWDKLNDWGTTLGLAAAGVGALLTKGGKEQTTVGIGAIVAVGSQLLGSTLGTKTQKRFAAKMAFIEFSRHAYDDLQERQDLVQANIRKADDVLTSLQTFSLKYDSAAVASDSTKIARLQELDSYILSFDGVLNQVGGVISLYESLLAKYVDPPKRTTPPAVRTLGITDVRNPSLQDALLAVQKKVAALKGEYPHVREFLDVTPELRKAIGEWKLPPSLLKGPPGSP